MTFPKRLIDGYRAFQETRLPTERSRYRQLAESGQHPEIMVIGCCDSRVSPEVIFDAHPGELFVVRNVANLVPPYVPTGFTHGVSAALEFAVEALRVKHIIVLGHARCGGIRAYAEHAKPLSAGDFIGKWMALITPVAEALGSPGEPADVDYLTRLEQASILKTIDNLMTFPNVQALVGRGDLHLHAAYFDVASGLLLIRDSDAAVFAPVAGAATLQSVAARDGRD
jgi:carbonic anhydrase